MKYQTTIKYSLMWYNTLIAPKPVYSVALRKECRQFSWSNSHQ